ncbi:MAG: hypothetical protein IPI41_03090 [Flavobacteriales bacterium]|nr:hypothetical protein [Flavobacteriales bacterium]
MRTNAIISEACSKVWYKRHCRVVPELVLASLEVLGQLIVGDGLTDHLLEQLVDDLAFGKLEEFIVEQLLHRRTLEQGLHVHVGCYLLGQRA